MGDPDTVTMILTDPVADHLRTARELITSLQRQIRMLEAEVTRLRTHRGVKVLVYGNSSDVQVAIACTDSEQQRWDATVEQFERRRDDFAAAKIAWRTVTDVQLNEVHTLPFKGPSR